MKRKSLFNCKFKGKPTPVYTVLSEPQSKDQAAICERLDNLYTKYKPVLDHDFDKKFPIETNQKYWELYLAHFLSQQFTLKPPKKNGGGPDFSFQHEGKTIWVEAVTPTPGKGGNTVPYVIYDGRARKRPKEKIILRYQSALDHKGKVKFKEYQEKNIVKDGDIQIIAVSDADLPCGIKKDETTGYPYILSALFPIGDYRIEINRNSGQSVGEGYGYQE